MSFLRGSSQPDPVVTPSYTGLQIQTSSSALPIPIIYGAALVAPNIIYSGGFSIIPIFQQEGSGGFLGIGDTHHLAITGYTFASNLIMGLCEGPIGGIGICFQDSDLYEITDLGATYRRGIRPPPDGPAFVPAPQKLDYINTAYAYAYQFDLGTSATTGSLNIEIYGQLAGTCNFNPYDADPALVIQDFLTNPYYGVGFPAASLDLSALLAPASGPDASYQTYCQAISIGLSPALMNQEAANSTIARWLQLTNSAAVWSGGKLKIIPYGDQPLTSPKISPPVTYTPNVTPVYDLTDDDFEGDASADPVIVSRTDPQTMATVVRLEVLDRNPTEPAGAPPDNTPNYYAATPVEAHSLTDIEAYGYRVGSTITAHEICYVRIGRKAAQLILQRGLAVRNTYVFKLSWEMVLLEPMDIVTLTDAGLGMDRLPVRIVDIEEDQDGLLTVHAEEFVPGAGTAADYATISAIGTARAGRNAQPEPVNPPVILESPPGLSDNHVVLVFGVSGGADGIADPNYGGCNIFVSYDDGDSYANTATLQGASTQGVLTAPLASYAGANPDTSSMLSVDLGESGGVLAPSSQTEAQDGNALIVVDREVISYGAATLTGSYAYDVTYLERGQSGSVVAAHAAGAPFLDLTGPIQSIRIPRAYIGSTLYFKFQSFNAYNRNLQKLSNCTPYSYTITGIGVS